MGLVIPGVINYGIGGIIILILPYSTAAGSPPSLSPPYRWEGRGGLFGGDILCVMGIGVALAPWAIPLLVSDSKILSFSMPRIWGWWGVPKVPGVPSFSI